MGWMERVGLNPSNASEILLKICDSKNKLAKTKHSNKLLQSLIDSGTGYIMKV